ncbi:MAG: hypothetical protein BGN88_03280 [Clostridiales bacterium 43-6]|nr:MAG: hypothetical protein BGN88_03280 [Clostridiales bacterium 43-6]
MELKCGQIVRSYSGRDKNTFLVITEIRTDCVFICDGKERPLERPKRKNLKHICPTNFRLSEKQMATNRELRRAIRDLIPQSGA